MNKVNKNIKTIIGRYLMIDKRKVKINKNITIDHLNDIDKIIRTNIGIFKYSFNRNFSTCQRYNYKYETKESNSIDYYVLQVIDKYSFYV
jgi:hypothetical protein